MSIYTSIKKPIISLAPMEDVTDSVFRQVICSVGKPDLFYTEFINVEGLNSKGKEKVIHRLKYDVVEKPIIAQLWGINPENFFKASQIVSDMGFDGIDINMGCSVQKISARGCGSGLINNTELSKEIINAVKEGSNGLPVSVKTRLGWKEYEVDSWIQFLLEQDLDVLTVHGRTARGSGVINANWDEISKCVKLRDEMGKNTLIFGNGDIKSLIQANEYVNKYGVDGVMIGRAAIGNPWIFTGREDIAMNERLELFNYHLELFKTVWGNEKDFNSLKKFFRAYIYGFEGAAEIRESIMKCKNIEEIQAQIPSVFPLINKI